VGEFELQMAFDAKFGNWTYQVSVTDTSVDVWGEQGEWLESFDSVIETVYAYDLY
tara:strand:- start:575 stop:739 length:165 start_codon:yes stop_codon:yes gene_type:complete